jgi:hypothetical protein
VNDVRWFVGRVNRHRYSRATRAQVAPVARVVGPDPVHVGPRPENGRHVVGTEEYALPRLFGGSDASWVGASQVESLIWRLERRTTRRSNRRDVRSRSSVTPAPEAPYRRGTSRECVEHDG